jgi:hypothetical protein
MRRDDGQGRMKRVPTSLLLAVRDMALLGAVTFGLGVLVTAGAAQRDLVAFTDEYGYQNSAFPWTWGLQAAGEWTATVLAWAFAVWLATRARAGHRTVRVPAALAAVAVGAITATGLRDVRGAFLWPGPAIPYRWHEDGTVTLDPSHPGWAFPPFVVVLLVAAALLGSRAGRRPDDAVAHGVVTTPRAGRAFAAVVVGLPGLGGTAGAVAAYVVMHPVGEGNTPADLAMSLIRELLLPLAMALIAAALLSGTGPLGALATALVAVPLAARPVLDWLAARASDLALAQAAGIALACLMVLLWRPAATLAGRAFAPTTVPASLPDEAAAV